MNLGKNKSSPPDSIDDFVHGVRTFAPHADVLVVNVSSPNTPGLRSVFARYAQLAWNEYPSGLYRGMQSRSLLQELLAGVLQARDETASLHKLSRKPKLVLKIAPDLSQDEIADVAAAVRTSGVDGVIVSNTTVQRPSNLRDGKQAVIVNPPTLT